MVRSTRLLLLALPLATHAISLGLDTRETQREVSQSNHSLRPYTDTAEKDIDNDGLEKKFTFADKSVYRMMRKRARAWQKQCPVDEGCRRGVAILHRLAQKIDEVGATKDAFEEGLLHQALDTMAMSGTEFFKSTILGGVKWNDFWKAVDPLKVHLEKMTGSEEYKTDAQTEVVKIETLAQLSGEDSSRIAKYCMHFADSNDDGYLNRDEFLGYHHMLCEVAGLGHPMMYDGMLCYWGRDQHCQQDMFLIMHPNNTKNEWQGPSKTIRYKPPRLEKEYYQLYGEDPKPPNKKPKVLKRSFAPDGHPSHNQVKQKGPKHKEPSWLARRHKKEWEMMVAMHSS